MGTMGLNSGFFRSAQSAFSILAAVILAQFPIAASPAAPAPAATAASADSSAAPYRGTAFDTERKEFGYLEDHLETFRDGRHVATRTRYLNRDGKAFARCELDFRRFAFKPDYLFKDLRNGYEEGAHVEASAIKVHFKDSEKAETHSKDIQVPEPCVINGGVGQFVKKNWAGLLAGKRIGFNMVIPARLDFFKFVAYLDVKRSVPDKEAAGRAHKAIVIEPQSTMLRMLLPTIVLYYDVKSMRMIRYQGIVNVADPKGRSLRVLVDYPGIGP
jgi:hypothetical protein